MKKLLVATLMLSATAMLAAPQSTTATPEAASPRTYSSLRQIQASIPFAFRAGKTVLPAGNYVFTFDPNHHAGWIEGVGHRGKIAMLSDYIPSGREPKLQFKRDGKVMVLQGVSEGPSSGEQSRQTGKAESQEHEDAPGH